MLWVHKLPCQSHSFTHILNHSLDHMNPTYSFITFQAMATKKSRVLVIGGTGYTGKFMVEGSVKAGNPTFALVREASLSDPVKAKTVQRFKDLDVTIVYVRVSSLIF